MTIDVRRFSFNHFTKTVTGNLSQMTACGGVGVLWPCPVEAHQPIEVILAEGYKPMKWQVSKTEYTRTVLQPVMETAETMGHSLLSKWKITIWHHI